MPIENEKSVIGRLNEKGYSIRKFSQFLENNGIKIGKSVISDIINNKYKGKESTINTVWLHINLLLADKQDLNLIIYPDIDLHIKVIMKCIKDKAFNDSETTRLIELNAILKKFKENQSSLRVPDSSGRGNPNN